MYKNRACFLASLAQHITSELVDSGMELNEAKELGLISADKFAEQWQGQLFYVPKNLKRKTEMKHAAILAEFNGSNLDELATKYKMNPRTIYKILKQNFYR